MKFRASPLIIVGFTCLASVSPLQAQSLDVGSNRTPMLSSVPAITLPKQHDNMIGQGFSSDERTAPLIPTESLGPAETSAAPRIPTTEITRGVDGMTISSPQDVVAPQKKPVKQAQQTKYTIGMTLSGVAKVFDGHSFLVDNHPVRLNGVDAPGLEQVCTAAGGSSWRCGEASRTFLKRLIDGKRVTCLVDALAGSGAAVSCSTVGIPDVTVMVVDAGMAVVNGHGRKYAEAQSAAQRKKAGLWVGRFTGPIEWRRNNP
jgi:endonuclease YncB( thermonuclease family)